jgi:glycosyltransferase involved in cell wall biosynthesis
LAQAPSQRFRVEAFFPLLHKEGIRFHADTFLSEAAWNVLYIKGSLLQKAGAVAMGFLKRLYTVCFTAWKYDYVFVHREASPVGPPVFEWMLAKVFRKKLIYDFDDAIWMPAISENNKVARSVKCFWKIKYLCKWAYKTSPGNAFLASFAARYNKRVHIIPTCVDTETRYNRLKDQGTVPAVVGWTGSHSTLKYLDGLVPVLQKLEETYDFTFLVICDKKPAFRLKGLQFLEWKEGTEIEDLLKIDIGVMPLEPDAWSEGKCGFKLIQYMALGMAAVASPVGVNKTIVTDGENGVLCAGANEWSDAIAALLQNKALREQFGKAGRKRVEEEYSLKANKAQFLSLFS